jgi:cytochrome c2
MLGSAWLITGCADRYDDNELVRITGGEPQHGIAVMRQAGCIACHTIPGVRNGVGLIGPNLGGIASRQYIAGVVSNTPENMIRWIRSPRSIDPRTAMPDCGVTERDARDIASYLYTLQ